MWKMPLWLVLCSGFFTCSSYNSSDGKQPETTVYDKHATVYAINLDGKCYKIDFIHTEIATRALQSACRSIKPSHGITAF